MQVTQSFLCHTQLYPDSVPPHFPVLYMLQDWSAVAKLPKAVCVVTLLHVLANLPAKAWQSEYEVPGT